MLVPFAFAADTDPAAVIQSKICSLVSPALQVAAAVAVLSLIWVGIEFFSSGNNVVQRQGAKQNLMYILIGLFIIVIAPYLVALFTGSQACSIVS
jgi:type IV secretory pathway VirB2 component (pilin)